MTYIKIAVVTGASSGMGREFVYALDRDEAFDEIWVIARREQRLRELQDRCRARIRPLPLDLQLRESFKTYRALLEQEKPEIAVLVNAAGFGLFGVFADMDMDEQLDIIDLNDRALTAMCHMSIPYMSPGSRIYNMGSMSSWQPVPYINVYGASKAYVLSFSRALSVELKKQGVRVMAVCPGWITTEFFDRAVHDDTISYYNRYYPPEQVVEQALRDMGKGRLSSVLGAPERLQARLVKLLPVRTVMSTWCRQQGK
ncbi:MAG: SDR family NAD(P)-dependent oxidoreductase [Oscillospiraceae bacterium]|nr:SDR family NAD(P)-dependent oxidoreductase [Oscillospiraceae bacterium]